MTPSSGFLPPYTESGADDDGVGHGLSLDGDGLHRADIGGGLDLLSQCLIDLADVLELAVVIELEHGRRLERALSVVLALVHIHVDLHFCSSTLDG